MKRAATGIRGFDSISLGGIPAGRTTLIEGGAGAGKTVFALETLVHGACEYGEPGIFVCFEESPALVRENARSFDWGLDAIPEALLFFFEAQPDNDLVQSGDVDISGLLAILQAKVRQMGAKRIVFDAIDMLLAQMPDPSIVRREVNRLKDWLSEMGLTAIITSKLYPSERSAAGRPEMGFLQFMVDCSILLKQDVIDGASQRNVRICKYRGSAFQENDTPFIVGARGIDVAFIHSSDRSGILGADERLSSGLPELDDMLEGGYFRGASILLTGYPGTAKTTLCGAFLEAACARGEKSLFVSFVSRPDEIVHNLQSVAVDLQPHIESGLLRMLSARALRGSAESHLLAIRTAALQHGATCIATDPLSALSKAGHRGAAPGVAERLTDWAKSEGITVICTSPLNDAQHPNEATPLQITTVTDVWIHLSNDITDGERNRRLSIVKARGTGHSNQVREFVLSGRGVTFKDVYRSDGEVLVGTQRGDRERSDQRAERERVAVSDIETLRLNGQMTALESRIAGLNAQLEEKRLASATRAERTAESADDAERDAMRDLRGG